MAANYVWLAYVGSAVLAVLVVLFLQRRWLLSLCTGRKRASPPKKNDDAVWVGRDPPDFDPDDTKPLPPKLPKYESFAYYLGNDLHQRLPEIQGKVDLLIVAPPAETQDVVTYAKRKKQDPNQSKEDKKGDASIELELDASMGMVEPCLGVTEDGELIMLENEAIVKDGSQRKVVPQVVADFGDGDENGDGRVTTLLVLVDLRTLCPEDWRKFDRHFKRFVTTVLHDSWAQGVVYRGAKETMQFVGANNLAALIQEVTLQNPGKLFLMEEGDELFDRVSDFLNGVVLLNPTLLPNGRHRPRFYNEETDRFDAFMAKLNTEIAIRNDFVTLALEAVRVMPSAELQANFVSWVDNMGFIGCITTDPRLCSVKDIKPLRLQLLKGGVVGMLDLPVIQEYYAKVAKVCQDAAPCTQPMADKWQDFLRHDLGLSESLLKFLPDIMHIEPKLWESENRVRGDSMHYAVQPVPENANFRYWPSVKTRGQRPIGEHNLDVRQEDHMLAALSFLQGEGHLLNIADAVKLELTPKSFDQFENDLVETSDPSFTKLRALLDDLISSPSAHAHLLMSMFPRNVVNDLRMLRNALAIRKVKVWVADKRVFFFKNDVDEHVGEAAQSLAQQIALQKDGQYRYMALFEDSAMDTNIYIARDHPSIQEAVLHCFFKSRGYTQSECVLLELLVQAQTEQREVESLKHVVSKRVDWELDTAPMEELVELILNTRATVRRLHANMSLNNPQRELLLNMAYYVLRKCRTKLLDDVDKSLEDMDHVSEMMGEATRAIEREITELLGYATIRAKAKDLFLSLPQNLATVAAHKNLSPETMAMIKYMHRLIHDAFQRVALKELTLKVSQKNPLPLPERDQVTVNIEMLVSRDKINFLFGLSSNQLGSIVYQHVRSKIVRSEVINRRNETKTELLDTQGTAAVFRRLASGMFFTIPALLDVVLVLFVGSGVFSSDRMSYSAVDVVNMSFLVVFSTMGGIMNSIARVCAYYFSQYSVPLMLAAAVRRFTAGLLFCFLCSIATAVVIVVKESPAWGILAFFYTLTFSVFIMFMSALFVMQTGNEVVWKPAGPRAVMVAMLILLVPCIITNVTYRALNKSLPFDVVFVYYGFMLIATVYLCYSFRRAAAYWCSWPHNITVTKVADIEKLYATAVKKPVRREGESITDHGKRVKRWEKRARLYFMQLVDEGLNKRSWFTFRKKIAPDNPYRVVEERIQQERSEKVLMGWYLMRTGQARQPYASFQWDVLLNQALGDIKRKFSVEKLNRGGILFNFEKHAIAFGWMYFFLIFIDRWITALSGNGLFVFFANQTVQSSDYQMGVGWATIFMLLSAGTFEINLASISFAEQSWDSARLGLYDKEGLVKARRTQKKRFYRAELQRFVSVILLIFAITTAFVLSLAVHRQNAIIFYAIGTFGYTGLLLGLFHKLFMANNDAAVNKVLFLACLTGVATGIALVVALNKTMWALSGIVVGGWVFGLGCILLQRRNLRVHRGVYLAPSLMSSGQEWYGPEGLAADPVVRDRVLEPIASDKSARLKIKPVDAIGREALNIIHDAAGRFHSLPPLVRAAFPNGEQMLHAIYEGVLSGRVKVYMVLASALHIPEASNQGYSALSEYDPDKDILRVYVGTVSNVGADMMVSIVAEAIVHEYMESFGLSHHHAVISELLLDADTRLPQRISYQLANMSGNGLLSVRSHFGPAIKREAALLINVSTKWRQVPSGVRRFLLDYMERYYDVAEDVLVSQLLDGRVLPDIANITMDDIHMFLTAVGAQTDELIDNPETLLRTFVARSCLSYELALRVNEVVDVMLEQTTADDFVDEREVLEETFAEDVTLSHMRWFAYRVLNFLRLTFMSATADARLGRELHFGHATPALLTYLLPLIYWVARQVHFGLSMFFLWNSPKVEHFLSRTRKGLNREIHMVKGKVAAVKYYDAEVPITAFVVQDEKVDAAVAAARKKHKKARRRRAGGANEVVIEMSEEVPMTTVNHYEGLHANMPKSAPLVVSEYAPGAKQLHLMRQFASRGGPGGKAITTFYHYDEGSKYLPAAAFVFYGNIKSIKDAGDASRCMTLAYDPKSGNVAAATLFCRNNMDPSEGVREIEAEYHYEDSGVGAPMVRAVYFDTQAGWSLTVQYAGSVSGEDSPHIAYVDYVDPRRVKYRTHFSYTHPLHPTMHTMKLRTGNIAHRRVKVETPLLVKNDVYDIINSLPPRSIYHHDLLLTRKLKKRTGSFSLRSSYWVGYFSRPATTQRKRMELWTLWRAGHIEGVFAMDIDEIFLREEPILQKYWHYRDHGNQEYARLEIEEKLVSISNLVVRDTPNTRTHLQMRISDLQSLGCGGDSAEITTADRDSDDLDRDILQVLSVDSGTWPTGGGGVGSCRRDLIDNLNRVRWTAIAEIGTDSEMVQKGYQAERYVNAIDYVPLWGLDMGTPNQHVLSDQPYGELELKCARTTDDIVRRKFVPLVRQLIYGMNLTDFGPHHQPLYAELFVKLHLYFQEFDWLGSWDHEAAKLVWYNTWFDVLTDNWTSDSKDADRMLQLEMPTLEDLDALYELIVRLLFPLTARLPRLSVVHASHHGVQSVLGVIAKTLYGSSLIIWDHGILWRERLLALTTLAPTVMPKFVQIGFAGLTRLCATLAYATANCVCPCTSIQNVQWEAYLGGGKYGNDTMWKNMFRKISPVLNGMDVDRFRVNKKLEREFPTTVMLSHVNRIKDVMNAVEAAAVIVHEFKLKQYQLLIYGSLESDPVYANECANAIVALNLSENVTLCGLGNPSTVLPAGWVFVNSSVSEGLPLAIGEAGLCGLPVVCTDVGGSREVLSDTIPGQPIDAMVTYGRIVPPRSPGDLAVAQLEVMGLLNGVEKIVDPTCYNVVTLDSLAHDPQLLLARMMDPMVKKKRRRLGLMLRARAFRVFPIARYLREHEQQLWVAALQCEHWDLWQMVQRYVMPRRRIATSVEEEDDDVPLPRLAALTAVANSTAPHADRTITPTQPAVPAPVPVPVPVPVRAPRPPSTQPPAPPVSAVAAPAPPSMSPTRMGSPSPPPAPPAAPPGPPAMPAVALQEPRELPEKVTQDVGPQLESIIQRHEQHEQAAAGGASSAAAPGITTPTTQPSAMQLLLRNRIMQIRQNSNGSAEDLEKRLSSSHLNLTRGPSLRMARTGTQDSVRSGDNPQDLRTARLSVRHKELQ